MNPPNGSRGPILPAKMSPAERKLWMVSHRAPADALLVYQDEFATITEQLQRAIACEGELKMIAAIISENGFAEGKKDLRSAVLGLVFDALRYRRASEFALGALARVDDDLDVIIDRLTHIKEPAAFTASFDLVNLRAKLAEAAGFVKTQSEAKLEDGK